MIWAATCNENETQNNQLIKIFIKPFKCNLETVLIRFFDILFCIFVAFKLPTTLCYFMLNSLCLWACP